MQQTITWYMVVIPALGHQNKGKSSFTGSGLFVLMSQCGNNNELSHHHVPYDRLLQEVYYYMVLILKKRLVAVNVTLFYCHQTLYLQTTTRTYIRLRLPQFFLGSSRSWAGLTSILFILFQRIAQQVSTDLKLLASSMYLLQ